MKRYPVLADVPAPELATKLLEAFPPEPDELTNLQAVAWLDHGTSGALEFVVPAGTAESVVRGVEEAALAEITLLEAQAANEATLRGRADAAIANLEAAWNGWGSLTAAQKDAALKLTVRVTIALARLVLRRLDAA